MNTDDRRKRPRPFRLRNIELEVLLVRVCKFHASFEFNPFRDRQLCC